MSPILVLLHFRARFLFVAAILCNIVAFARSILSKPLRIDEEHIMYLRNLNFSGFLMGVYMFIIVRADFAFSEEYIKHGDKWRHSYLCGFASKWP